VSVWHTACVHVCIRGTSEMWAYYYQQGCIVLQCSGHLPLSRSGAVDRRVRRALLPALASPLLLARKHLAMQLGTAHQFLKQIHGLPVTWQARSVNWLRPSPRRGSFSSAAWCRRWSWLCAGSRHHAGRVRLLLHTRQQGPRCSQACFGFKLPVLRAGPSVLRRCRAPALGSQARLAGALGLPTKAQPANLPTKGYLASHAYRHTGHACVIATTFHQSSAKVFVYVPTPIEARHGLVDAMLQAGLRGRCCLRVLFSAVVWSPRVTTIPSSSCLISWTACARAHTTDAA